MKFLIGGAATSLLAWGAYAVGGSAYVGGLGESASAALADAKIEGVALDDMTAYQPLSRIAVLSGDGLTAEQKAAAEQAVRSVDGIAGVRWAGEADGEASGPEAGEASAEAVDSCQQKLDAVTAGKRINFRSGSAYMPDSSLEIVGAVADAMKACGGMTLAVSGHTDSTGSDAINTSISQARADAVAAVLAERGVDASRITAKGLGSSKPLAEGDGANADNRRIEFDLSSGTPAKVGGEEGE